MKEAAKGGGLTSSRQQLAARFVDQVAPSRNESNLAHVSTQTRSGNNSVARRVRIISAARRAIGSRGGCSHCSCSDTYAYRHPRAHTTVNASTIDTTMIDTTMIDAAMIDASPTNANASSKCKGVS
jgi:hypothetical protein